MSALNRRALLTGAGAAGFAAALGAPIPFARHLPAGLTPVALGQDDVLAREAKPELTVLGDRPVNMETPPHLLDDEVTPATRFFVRNNGSVPFPEEMATEAWRLTVDGEVDSPLELSIADLEDAFETVTLRLVIECAGNGRRFFTPGASGNQWSFGAVGCAEWTGVRLADVLKRAGVRDSAVYTAHHGADRHLSGNPDLAPISRGVPIDKALEAHSLIAWAMNGEPLPAMHGAPLRLVVPGWPGSCSQKWLTRIQLRDQVHDGEKMTGTSYRVPAYPVAPGTDVPEEDMRIIHSLPVKSLITAPRTGARATAGEPLEVRGAAWSGDVDVERVDVSTDFGATWRPADLAPAPNRYSWRRWRADVAFPIPGYYEVWARATDAEGAAQPATTPGWNPKGYLNNMQHRIAVFAL